MNVFFSSDYHFYHFNIIKYCNRPFNNVEKMNKTIIDNHNSRVKENDTIIFLGDFGFFASKNKTNRGEGQPYNPDELLEQMNGHKWTFIKGNHDKHSNKLKTDIHYICINKKNLHIQCIHNPENANLNFDLILCGHVHNAWKAKEVQFNNKKILIIGDVMIDAYMWGSVDRISPEAPVPIASITNREKRLGGAANVGLNVRALGAEAILCAVIGDDDNGNVFKQLLKKRNLTSKGILVDKNRDTTIKTRIICDNQHLLRVDEEICEPLTSNLENKFIEHLS